MPTTKKAKTLNDLLVNKLMALYDVEIQIVKALPKMAKKAKSSDLVKGFEDHVKDTKEHVKRLEQCFKLLAIKPKKLQSEAIRGLVNDASWVMKHVQPGPALDANLIAAAQYVEHYEIAGYGTAIEWARILQEEKIQQLLTKTLGEEKSGDETLTKVAQTSVHKEIEKGV